MDVNNLKKNRIIFDPIYGFIQLTPVENEIVHSAYYQRLRWIKQLGFSCYIFPGAEHSRFGHSIGALHNCDAILQSCGIGVSIEELSEYGGENQKRTYHQNLRLAALMHDLGTFPFSHTTEMSYINFSETKKLGADGKILSDDHENLGSFIIKNTDFEGGITHILKKYGLDPKVISNLVKGVDPSILANQILHSEIDCDRMDYLLRDAHYTGLKYGAYDRDYLLHHFKVMEVAGHNILTIKHNAIHCVEDFLVSRFAWYSQVIRSPRGAKYDAVAERVCSYLLAKNKIVRYSELLEMISKSPLKFYAFNDIYFMNTVHKNYLEGTFDKDKDVKDMAETLLLQKPIYNIKLEAFNKQLLHQDDQSNHHKAYKKAEDQIQEIEIILKNKGQVGDWLISDLPKKDIVFVKSKNRIVKQSGSANVLLERDPVKISYDNGEVKLLAQVEDSFMNRLEGSKNFIPNVFCSASAYQLLVDEGIIQEDR